jgi:hypothetical protein
MQAKRYEKLFYARQYLEDNSIYRHFQAGDEDLLQPSTSPITVSVVLPPTSPAGPHLDLDRRIIRMLVVVRIV